MDINNINYKSSVTKALLPNLTENIFVVDVGASKGYPRIWRSFPGKLTLHGFDPLIHEVERLNNAEKNPNIKYHAAYVLPVSVDKLSSIKENTKRKDRVSAPGGSALGARLAAVKVKKMTGYNRIKEEFNSGQELAFANHGVSLDDFFRETGYEKIDFIKIDTDGHDYQVLTGAQKILCAQQVLGLDVEVRFTGAQRDDANLFRNVDKILGEAGFSLFHFEKKRYARSALPRPFLKNRPTVSDSGQIRWANAVYLRDLGDPNHEAKLGGAYSLQKILKMICLFDLYDLPDCAVEVVHKYRDIIASEVDPESILNLLTPSIGDQKLTYREYMEQFNRAVEYKKYYEYGREII
ncbi:FkbM family methyltransferase [Gilvimarinus sp. 1_MG-2023]|uniref:FkbM family methyltransferase n=1 Tax=Gilvimarinus sp. 1_MG-2023 TaxID=3062638 RepID=UPI0026E19598|nr:FkbM family methyltransferase [Gilvimarinus sp. 1_MG-2023]MDO6746294.1 FkbM family methyltransferase [Gilvimarinus sp. 1_MG-2023]